jgi:hypothetical protein
MDINYLAVLVSALVSMIIGSIWFGPLFGKQFIHATGMDQWSPEKQALMKKTMGISYFLQFLASLVMFFVLSKFMSDSGQMTVHGGLVTALWLWIGFVVPLALGNAIWGGSKKVFWLTTSHMLITLLVIGAIIGAWN